MYQEILQLFPRTPSPEPEQEDHPPPPPVTSIGQQPRFPSPELEYLDEEMHTVPPRPPTPESLDNVEPENNNLDEDLLDGLQVEEDPNVP